MREECFNKWLDWDYCSSTPGACNRGVSWRYKFYSTSEFKYQTQPCNPEGCAAWSRWRKPFDGCSSDCTVTWTRKCLKDKSEVDPSRCPFDKTIAIGNETHQILPCQDNTCILRNVPNPFPPPRQHFREPPVTPPPVGTTTQPLTLPPVQRIVYPSEFSAGTFMIGFCIGGVVILVLLVFIVFIYCKSNKGSRTIAAIKMYRQNEKRYYDRKQRNNAGPIMLSQRTPLNQNHPTLSQSRTSVLRDYDSKTLESSGGSYHTWRKDEGYRSYPTIGSLSGTSKYQESLNQFNAPYGTYYTPVGESKLLSPPQKRYVPTHIVQGHMSEPQMDSSTDSFEDASDSDSTYTRSHRYEKAGSPTASINLRNGAFYYEKHFNSHGRRHKGGFDEDAYMRSYEAQRAGRRRHRPSESRRVRRSRTFDRYLDSDIDRPKLPRKRSERSYGRQYYSDKTQEYRPRKFSKRTLQKEKIEPDDPPVYTSIRRQPMETKPIEPEEEIQVDTQPQVVDLPPSEAEPLPNERPFSENFEFPPLPVFAQDNDQHYAEDQL